MSPTTPKFGWKDRDSAARDLLQLVYHAPEYISLRALELLPAIRSPAIVPELLEIFRDKNSPAGNRQIALRTIAQTDGDLFLPELKSYFTGEEKDWYAFRHSILRLVKNHPSNRGWFFDYQSGQFAYVDSLPLSEQYPVLLGMIAGTYREYDEARFRILVRLINLIKTQPELLDLDGVIELRFRDNRLTTQAWLIERLETVEYLCLTGGNALSYEWDRDLVGLLENWAELKESLFHHCPSFITEYETKKRAIEVVRNRYYPPIDLTQSPVWQELEELYTQAATGDEKARGLLNARMSAADSIPEKALAAHFLGKLCIEGRQPIETLIHWMRDSSGSGVLSRWSDFWFYQHPINGDWSGLHSPVRFELGDVLRTYPSPRVWETLRDSYFSVASSRRYHFVDWIAYQTDRLSGSEVEYTGATYPIEDRPWFRAFVEKDRHVNRTSAYELLAELPVLEHPGDQG